MNIKFDSQKFNITTKNPLFSQAKVYVMYHGENRNNSHISKEDVEKAIGTMFNIPIVGEFIESESDSEENNFGSHGGKIVIDDNGMKYIHTTKPVGVIPESAKFYWEKVKDEKEREREYLVVDGALVWNRYESEVETLKSDNFGQSMEIEVEDGWFDDESGNYHITDFAFSAFCILGLDGRKNGGVEPAFEDSKIITYSRDIISQEMKEMKNELKDFYSLYAEGKEDNNLKDLKDKVVKDEEFEAEDEAKKDEDKVEDDAEDKDKEPEVIQDETTGIDGKAITDEDEAEKQQGTSGDTDADAGTTSDADVIADANTDTSGATDTTDADTTSDARAIADANTDSDYAKLKEEFEALQDELKELKEFKANVEKEEHEKASIELFEKMGLAEEDVKGLDIYKYSLDELEEKCYVILGRKAVEGKADFSKKEDKVKSNTTNKVELSEASKPKPTPYGRLFSKYGQK